MPDTKTFVAKVAAELCLERLGRGKPLGVFIENLPPLDPDTFVSTLTASKRQLRIALLGGKRVSAKGSTEVAVTQDPTEANSWRNDPLAKTKPCVTLVLGPAPKLNSLRSAVPLLGPEELRSKVVDRSILLQESPARKALWKTLGVRSGEVPLANLLQFAAEVSSLGTQAALLEQEPQLLYLLGLMRHKALSNASTTRAVASALRRNLELVSKLRALPAKEREQITTLLKDSSTTPPEVKDLAQTILRFERLGKVDDLVKLDFDEVQGLLKARPSKPHTYYTEEEGTEPIREKVARLDGDSLALDLLLEEDAKGLVVAAKRFKEALHTEENDESHQKEITVGKRQITPRAKTGTAQATALFSKLLSLEAWGGYLQASNASDFISALKLFSSGDTEQDFAFKPEQKDQARELLSRSVNMGIIPGETLVRWDKYAFARAALLEHAAVLIDHPLLALAGSAELRKKAEILIVSYQDALAAVKEAADALRSRNTADASRRLLARTLCLDVVFIKSAREFNALCAPTHPFHLWRWLTLLALLKEHKGDFSELGNEILEPLFTEPPASAPHIVLGRSALETLERSRAFIAVGAFGALPLFGEPSARGLGKFRASSLSKIAARLTRLMPHAAFGLRVLLIDPPNLSGTMEQLLSVESPFDNERVVPVHVSIARTQEASETTDEEDEELESISHELRSGGGSLDVLSGIKTLEELSRHLETHPAHLTVVFEPGDGQELRVGLASPPSLSPLVLPRAYHYDAFDDRLDVVVVGEGADFSGYHNLFCEVLELPREDFIGRRSGASRCAKKLQAIAAYSIWTVIVDQGLEPTLRLEGALRLDWRSDGGRDLVTFTAHPSAIQDLVTDAVRLSGLKPSEEMLKRTLNQLYQLGGEALFALAKPGPTSALVDPRIAKATIGVLAALRWLALRYPDSIVISLDDPLSRRWILGAESDNRHGDLLALRSGADGLVVEAIEVKAHDDAEATVQERAGLLDGKAITQVGQTARILRRILASKPSSALDQARREILRDQLYRAVASRSYTSEQRARFVNLLEELFQKGPALLCGLVFQVKIVSERGSISPSNPRFGQDPDGLKIGIVELIESEPATTAVTLPSSTPTTTTETPTKPKPTQAHEPRRGPSEPTTPPNASSAALNSSELLFLVGHNPAQQSVFWEPHKPGQELNNFGFLVTGDSGAGKTQVLRSVIAEIARMGLPVWIFDFKNDYADESFSTPLQLKVHDVNRGGLPFNPLSLLPDAQGEVQPIRSISELTGIIRRVFGLGDQQEAQLKKAMGDAYEAKGINIKKWSKLSTLPHPPSFTDVFKLLEADSKTERLRNRVSPLFDLGLFPEESQVNLTFEELLASQIVLDLHNLPKNEIKAAIAELVITRLHSYVLRGEQPRKLRRLLVFDEAWRIKDSLRLEELAREGRAFGVSIAIGTQFPGDLPDNLAGNLATQLFLYNKEAEHRKSVARSLSGSSTGPMATKLIQRLDQLQKHEGFFKNQHYSPYILVNTLPYYKRTP